jgi:hypothetical protein
MYVTLSKATLITKVRNKIRQLGWICQKLKADLLTVIVWSILSTILIISIQNLKIDNIYVNADPFLAPLSWRNLATYVYHPFLQFSPKLYLALSSFTLISTQSRGVCPLFVLA